MKNSTVGEEVVQYWSWVAEYLEAELESVEDSTIKTHLRHDLFRVLFDRLDRSRDALSYIDDAMAGADESRDLAWDSYRASLVRDSRTKVQVLEQLVKHLSHPDDRANALLDIAALQEQYLDDDDAASESRERARGEAPQCRSVLWWALVRAQADGDREGTLEALEQLADQTDDSVWEATLRLERMVLEREGGAEGWEVQELIDRLLGLPSLDWPMVNEILETTEALELWESHGRVRELLADKALSPEPTPVEGKPDGHAYDGFERGSTVAAGHLWLLAVVRERKLENTEGALEAIEKALQLVPDDVFISMERARLLESLGRHGEALDELTDETPSSWKAQLSLGAGRVELVPDFAREASREVESLVPEVLMEIASGGGSADEGEVAPEVVDSTAWLAANPVHSEAHAVAVRLEAAGDGSPVTAMILGDQPGEDQSWPPDTDLDSEEPWVVAVRAIVGQHRGRSASLLEWSERTRDHELAPLLQEAAADAAEREGQLDSALALLEKARDSAADGSSVDASITRVLRRLDRWTQLAGHLEKVSSESLQADRGAAALALRAIILEYSKQDYDAAAQSIDDISNQTDGDPIVGWSAFRLAVRQADWDRAIEHLDRLIRVCSDDAHELGLLAGEIELHVAGRLGDAVDRLAALAECDSAEVAFAARVHLIGACQLSGDRERLGQLLEREISTGDPRRRDLWLHEILEAGRVVFGNEAVLQLLGMFEVSGKTRMLWDLILDGALSEPGKFGASVRSLAESDDEKVSLACKLAVAMVDPDEPSRVPDFSQADLESDEMLWVVSDRLDHNSDPALRELVFGERTRLCSDEDSAEWIDWTLCRADALEDLGKVDQALELIRSAILRFPEHPAILEAFSRLAFAAQEFVDAADAHGRLAGYYASMEQKATQLARAARIMHEQLGDHRGAERIAREAVKRAPSHEEAHEVLSNVLRAIGDEDALAKQIEERIDAQEEQDDAPENDEALLELYEEQVDRLYAVDDLAGALEAVDKILFVAPERLPAHRTKIDLLMGMGQWEDAVDAMFEFCFVCDDKVEARTMIWQAAQVLAEDMSDTSRALSELMDLVNGGDEHPQTIRLMATIAADAGMWEEASEALGRLAPLVKETDKRAQVLKERAQILIEHLFDPDSASSVLDEALRLEPGFVDAVKLMLEFTEEEDTESRLQGARTALRDKLNRTPINPASANGLKEISRMLDNQVESTLAAEAAAIMSGTHPAPPAQKPAVPSVGFDHDLIGMLFHPDEAGCAASEVAVIAAPITAEVFGDSEVLPPYGKNTLVHRKSDDPVRIWLSAWAGFLGAEKFELHRTGSDPRGSRPLPATVPAIAVNPDSGNVTDNGDVFFMARGLWRAVRGLAPFEEGDAAMPVRWIMALTAAVLGDDAGLPLPTDRDLVDRAKKALPRKIRKRLTDPCKALTKLDPGAIRSWVLATSYSADRFGMLASGYLGGAIPMIVEEAAGPIGLKQLGERPVSALGKIPRCGELLRFVLADNYLELRSKIFRKGGE